RSCSASTRRARGSARPDRLRQEAAARADARAYTRGVPPARLATGRVRLFPALFGCGREFFSAPTPLTFARPDPVSDAFLAVAEHHHGLVEIEERIVQPRVARGHRALVHEHGARLVRLDDGHAVDRAARLLGERIDDVVRAEHEHHVGGAEIAVDVL